MSMQEERGGGGRKRINQEEEEADRGGLDAGCNYAGGDCVASVAAVDFDHL